MIRLGKHREHLVIDVRHCSYLSSELRGRDLIVQGGKPALAVAFVSSEKEDFIPDNRPADRASVLVIDQAGLILQKLLARIEIFRVVEPKALP